MNPDKINARLVIPVATYKEIVTGYPVDMFLYANNYEDGEELEFFHDAESAMKVFKEGKGLQKEPLQKAVLWKPTLLILSVQYKSRRK